MKQQNNPIQLIISEIDEVLSQSSTRNTPQVLAETLRKSQKILQQIVDYLDRDVKEICDRSYIDHLASENETDLIEQKNRQSIEEVLAPISYYLQEDFAILRQQQQALQAEIRQLEQQKQDKYIFVKQNNQQDGCQIISEFSQDLISSDISKKSENKLEKNIQFEAPVFDDREEKQQNIEINVTPKSGETELLNDWNNQVVLPYPGYEFLEKVESKSNTQETETKSTKADNSNVQESSISNDEQVNLGAANSPQLSAPIFVENNQNKTDKIEDRALDITSLSSTPKSEIEKGENRENLEDEEILQSLSNLFGNFGSPEELKETETNQLPSASEEEDIYIHALGTENLLPVEEVEVEQKRELLLDINSLDNLRFDLESLEEIDLDEFIDDDPEQTQLQLGESENVDVNANPPDISHQELTHLEDIFANIADNLPEASTTKNQDRTDFSAENTENELTLENILDSSISSEEPEIIDTDNQEILSLETLLEESEKLEKKNLLD